MLNSFFKMYLFLGLVLGLMLAISSTTWFGVFLGLEMNLIMFIPFLFHTKHGSPEAGLKYFLIQACGSILIIFSSASLASNKLYYFMLIGFALLLKVGSAPLHFWYPLLVEELSWESFFILATFQKLAPLMLIFYSCINFLEITTFVVVSLNASIGALGGINEFSLRKMLAFSSINHLGWLLLGVMKDLFSCFIYFLFYCLIMFSVVYYLFLLNLFHFNQALVLNMNLTAKTTIFSGFASLGGLPPFLGFLPKWIIVHEMMVSLNSLLLFILISANIITLYFYTRFLILLVFLKTSKSYTKMSFYFSGVGWTIFNSLGVMTAYIFM